MRDRLFDKMLLCFCKGFNYTQLIDELVCLGYAEGMCIDDFKSLVADVEDELAERGIVFK